MKFDVPAKRQSSREVDLVGLVLRYDKFSATFIRILLQVDGIYVWAIRRVNLSSKPDSQQPSIGALVRVTGYWKLFRGIFEIEVESLEIVAQSARWPGGRSARSIELLGLRSLVVQEMHAMFRDWGSLPVESPKIVSEWTLGDTTPFEIQFYDCKQFLSISNMIYHQMLACKGFNCFYEIGKLFRQEKPSSRRKLAEFTIVDISRVGVGIDRIMRDFERLILASVATLNQNAHSVTAVEKVDFETLSWTELMVRAGDTGGSGSQLNSACRQYLNKHYESFVWITGFPVEKRPFYTKATDGLSHDCQLWYRGEMYLVAGSEVETDIDLLRKRIHSKGSNPSRYRDYLDVIQAGMPLVSMAGMGVERFLSLVLKDTVAADFSLSPRFQNGRVF